MGKKNKIKSHRIKRRYKSKKSKKTMKKNKIKNRGNRGKQKGGCECPKSYPRCSKEGEDRGWCYYNNWSGEKSYSYVPWWSLKTCGSQFGNNCGEDYDQAWKGMDPEKSRKLEIFEDIYMDLRDELDEYDNAFPPPTPLGGLGEEAQLENDTRRALVEYLKLRFRDGPDGREVFRRDRVD